MLIALLLRLAFQPVKTCGFLKMVGNKLNGFYLPHFIRTNFSKAPPPLPASPTSMPPQHPALAARASEKLPNASSREAMEPPGTYSMKMQNEVGDSFCDPT